MLLHVIVWMGGGGRGEGGKRGGKERVEEGREGRGLKTRGEERRGEKKVLRDENDTTAKLSLSSSYTANPACKQSQCCMHHVS